MVYLSFHYFEGASLSVYRVREYYIQAVRCAVGKLYTGHKVLCTKRHLMGGAWAIIYIQTMSDYYLILIKDGFIYNYAATQYESFRICTMHSYNTVDVLNLVEKELL